jgi:hypothetical protein
MRGKKRTRSLRLGLLAGLSFLLLSLSLVLLYETRVHAGDLTRSSEPATVGDSVANP